MTTFNFGGNGSQNILMIEGIVVLTPSSQMAKSMKGFSTSCHIFGTQWPNVAPQHAMESPTTPLDFLGWLVLCTVRYAATAPLFALACNTFSLPARPQGSKRVMSAYISCVCHIWRHLKFAARILEASSYAHGMGANRHVAVSPNPHRLLVQPPSSPQSA